jgi:hypothetical protein
MLKKLLILLFAIAGGTLVYSTSASAVLVADATIDCSVDENGPGSTDEIETVVPVVAPVSYQVDVTGCDFVCGGGDSTVDTGDCGSANFIGGAPVSVNFTGYGWVQAYKPSTLVTKRILIVPDESDMSFVAEAGDGSATFSWNVVDNDFTYSVTPLSSGVRSSCDAGAGESSCTIDGLTNGTEYEFRLLISFNDGSYYGHGFNSVTVTPAGVATTTTTTAAPSTTSVEDTLVPTGSSSTQATWFSFILIALGTFVVVFRRRTF